MKKEIRLTIMRKLQSYDQAYKRTFGIAEYTLRNGARGRPVHGDYDLMQVLPKEHRIRYNISMIRPVREICKASASKCGLCFWSGCCLSYKKDVAGSRKTGKETIRKTDDRARKAV